MLTGNDLRDVRSALGLSVDEISDLFCVARFRWLRWESEPEPDVDGIAARLLRLLKRHLIRVDRSLGDSLRSDRAQRDWSFAINRLTWMVNTYENQTIHPRPAA